MPIPKNQEKIARRSIKDQIYQTMCDWIIDGTLQPGEPISDTEVAKYFSASRTPVREALLLLEQQNFVRVTPSCGTKVAPMTKDEAEMIYEALAELCGSAAKLACSKRSAEDIRQLCELNEAFAAAIDSGDQLTTLKSDADFHSYIFQIARNSYLSDYAKQLTIHTRRYEYYFFKNGEDKSTSVQQHQAIIDAIERRDEAAARRYSEQNWLGFYHNKLKALLQ